MCVDLNRICTASRVLIRSVGCRVCPAGLRRASIVNVRRSQPDLYWKQSVDMGVLGAECGTLKPPAGARRATLAGHTQQANREAWG
jgi:hypothetical protein